MTTTKVASGAVGLAMLPAPIVSAAIERGMRGARARSRGSAGSGRFLAVACLAVALLVGRPAAGDAATFVVDSTLDVADLTPADALCKTPAGACTLRAAIQQANTLAGVDTIEVPAGYYQLTIAGTGEDLAATGDLDVTQSVVIRGTGAPGTVTIDGGFIDRIFHVTSAGATVTIDGLWMYYGDAGVDVGGGVYNAGTLTLTNCVVVASRAGAGGGIENAGVLIVVDSLVGGNTVTAGSGGGLENESGATMTLRRSTVVDNEASPYGGGGIANFGSIEVAESLLTDNRVPSGAGGGGFATATTNPSVLTNTTISGNTIDGSGSAGAGILLVGNAPATLNNVTIADNHGAFGSTGGGIGAILGVGALTLSNTIVADNTAGAAPDCGTSIASGGFNLIGDTTGCTVTGDTTGNILGGFANLGPLGPNGGPTDSHALLPGSQAIDAGNNLLPIGSGGNACSDTDQRLGPRPLDGNGDFAARCDIGAVEVGCGNRFVEAGEICDDPCCDASCTSFLPPGSSCEDGDRCTAGETCDLSEVCSGGAPVTCGSCEVCDSAQGCIGEPPATDCRAPLGAKKSFLSFKPGKTPEKNALIWKWGRGPETLASEFGYPASGTTDFDLCVYDASDQLLVGARVPSASDMPMCGIRPCWKALANGNFKYGNKEGTPEGVSALTLVPGVDGKAKLALKAKGSQLSFPALPLSASVKVQLKRRDLPICWGASFSANVLKNKVEGYTAQSD